MKTISNNQPFKSIRNLMLWILAITIVSCNDNIEVGITPEGSQPQANYNTADGIYYGDIMGNGVAAFFRLELYHSSNTSTGLIVMGFCTLPNSFANFRLDLGAYPLSTNGTARTFFPGMLEDGTVIGTVLVTTEKVIFIKSGTATVALSGSTYTIDGVFAGEDAVTGALENNIRIRFAGRINFTDGSNTQRRRQLPNGDPLRQEMEQADESVAKRIRVY
jgi:hypothetical protein